MISPDDFTTADPKTFYARMRPDQRTAIANEFIRLLRLAGDPGVARFTGEDAGGEPVAASPETAGKSFDAQPPTLESPEQVASIHTYTREHRPDIFKQVAHHPVTIASLAHAGDRVEEAAQTEDVIVQGPSDEQTAEEHP
jgi:hypothetical protein